MIVRRKDWKTFKSGRQYNTVKEEVIHWKFNEPAYTFEEDDSCVLISKVEALDEKQARNVLRHQVESIFIDRVNPVFEKYELKIGEDIENVYWHDYTYGKYYQTLKNVMTFEMRKFTAEFLFDLAKVLDTYQIETRSGRQISGCDTCGHGEDSFVILSFEFDPLTPKTESV